MTYQSYYKTNLIISTGSYAQCGRWMKSRLDGGNRLV